MLFVLHSSTSFMPVSNAAYLSIFSSLFTNKSSLLKFVTLIPSMLRTRIPQRIARPKPLNITINDLSYIIFESPFF